MDAEFSKAGTIELIGRAGTQKRPQSHQQGYYFLVSDTGAWTILKRDSRGRESVLGNGSAAPLGMGSWHRLSFSFRKDHIVASLDGKQVTALADDSYDWGQIGIGIVGYDADQFDNLSITPPTR